MVTVKCGNDVILYRAVCGLARGKVLEQIPVYGVGGVTFVQ
jgi:hypothetical protein